MHGSRERRTSALRHLLTGEAGSGLVLMLVAAAALVVANSPWAASYFALLKTYIGGLSLLHWINDGLMAVFFLLVGLEIKREMVDGQLSTWSRRALPGVAAAGGMVVPAAIYVWINAETPNTLRGWAIPAATDIAFALGVLSLLGRRVPVSLKVFLTALAIIDDLGAVAIIAMFYTSELSITWLGLAFALLGVLFALNRARIDRLPIYLLVGVVLWYLVLKSGVHATLAGVALAIAIPVRPSPGKPDDAHSPLHVLEHSLRPWVGYLIVPIFGFANAGVSVVGLSLTAVLSPITIGVAAGLFFGKQFGVFLSTWLTVRSGLATRLEGASWGQVYGVSIIAGIGFTMSLFIGLLAFPDEALQDEVKIGVLLGSVASAIMGAAWLVACSNRAR